MKEHPLQEHLRRASSRLHHARGVVMKHDLDHTPATDPEYTDAIAYEKQCEQVESALLLVAGLFGVAKS